MEYIRRFWGIWVGIAVFLAMIFLPSPEGLSPEAWRTAAVTALMAIWWISEAIPIYATALVPIILFPFLGISDIGGATTPYANPIIYLFLGGFFLAIAMERWQLHRRIALSIVLRSGVKSTSIIFGFMLASALLSMFVSNTATAIMMLPIAISILDLTKDATEYERRNFQIVLILGIAYGCNIGGMGTLIGSPPNALLAGFFMENYGFEVSFLDWMIVGVPVVFLSLPLVFLLLTRFLYPIHLPELKGGKAFIQGELTAMGRVTAQETMVGMVFFITASLWIIRPFISEWIPGLSDAGIAIGSAVVLFLLPSLDESQRSLLSWNDTKRMPWGVLILFGGGLSMASAISGSGLAQWIGQNLTVLGQWPTVVLIIGVVSLMIFLTELTSNTASTAAFLPIIASLALGLGENPLLLAMAVTLAASCAFMLPVATPPNAIVYGTERITIPQMAKAGLWVNLLFIGLITLVAYVVVMWWFGIELGVVPDWAV
ncbi:MAG: DASS family sodium-coupled anion symporter [Bacteroidetes bacterium]|nr:DASS family sodium-coupled anion symporter [Bacteroidota bacterium]